jgi:hypothetical protein
VGRDFDLNRRNLCAGVAVVAVVTKFGDIKGGAMRASPLSLYWRGL